MNDSTFNRREALATLARNHGLTVTDTGPDTFYSNGSKRIRVSWYFEPHPVGTRPTKWTDAVCEVFNERHSDTYPLNDGWSMVSMRTSAYRENFKYAMDRIVELGDTGE